MPSVAQLPRTPPVGHVPNVQLFDQDLAALDDLTSEPYLHLHPKSQSWRRRDAPLDPLLFAAAAASGPHVTRHHYHHDFFPSELQLAGEEEDLDWSKWAGEIKQESKPKYASKQAPRSQRLREEKPKQTAHIPVIPERSVSRPVALPDDPVSRVPSPQLSRPTTASIANFTSPPFDAAGPDVQVQCLSRARIPTPHGSAFLHLYRNNRDNKEHLAVVVDPAQLESPLTQSNVLPIRSRSLDAVWNPAESHMDRIVRGAYLGRLTSTTRNPSSVSQPSPAPSSRLSVPAPLVRIHSECYTGETIGSMRCDCGEQLDEALRLISLPVPVSGTRTETTQPSTVPGRGVIVYMRQEGRGIGLLSKLRAYNLQDMGHDTVTANLMLGHGADERGYEVAGAILRDLGVGGEEEGLRLLTNNPEKVRALENEGVRIVERVEMVPRSWQHDHSGAEDSTGGRGDVRAPGVTLIGAGAAHGEELEKYLRTKVDRMGHMLTLPPSPPL